MKTIIAPAKKMTVNLDDFPVQSQPLFLPQTKQLLAFLKTRTIAQLKEIWQASDKIVAENFVQLQDLDLKRHQTPAILAFSGLQYQYLAPDVMTTQELDYLQENLRILSGFYGSLRPFDGVIPYRLEMKSKMIGFKDYSLYHFWGEKIANSLFEEDDLVINLASKEYARVVAPYLGAKKRMISVDFQEKGKTGWRTIATHAKMARGEMVRFMAREQIKNPADLRDFNDFGFKFVPAISSSDHYVFRSEYDFKSKFRS